MTRDEIIIGALQLIGARDATVTSADITAAEQTIGTQKLDALIADISKKSELWVKRLEAAVPVNAGNAVYDLNTLLANYAGEPEIWFYPSLFPVLNFTASVAAGGTLTASTAYYYRVGAYDTGGNCIALSPEATATTTSSNKTINLSWTAVTGAATYRIYRSTRSLAQVSYKSQAGTTLADDGSVTFPTTGSVYDGPRSPVNALTQGAWDASAYLGGSGAVFEATINPADILMIRPVPVQNGLLLIRYRSAMLATSGATSVPDMPVQWGLALQYGLAVELGRPYRVPLAEVADLRNEWAARRRSMEEDERQDNHIEIGVAD